MSTIRSWAFNLSTWVCITDYDDIFREVSLFSSLFIHFLGLALSLLLLKLHLLAIRKASPMPSGSHFLVTF